MRRDEWKVGEFSIRPAGKNDQCFYCNEKIGQDHKSDCVIRNRTVIVRFSIDVLLEVCESFDEEEMEFQYGESSWCANNIIEKLVETGKNIGCLCGITQSKFIREATEDDEKFYCTYVNEIPS